MIRFVMPLAAMLVFAAAMPAHAQGQGGYARGCPGAETVRMPPDVRAQARAARQTNDTSGGRSSIDKSCKTWEGGGTWQPVPGSITWMRPEDAGDRSRGYGGAHTRW